MHSKQKEVREQLGRVSPPLLPLRGQTQGIGVSQGVYLLKHELPSFLTPAPEC